MRRRSLAQIVTNALSNDLIGFSRALSARRNPQSKDSAEFLVIAALASNRVPKTSPPPVRVQVNAQSVQDEAPRMDPPRGLGSRSS